MMPHMRLRHVEIFSAVMRCGSVKGAAQLLHITQPAASRLLQQAERHAGLTLFRRERGRLVPTREAELLQAEVEQLDQQLDRIRRLVDNLRRGPDDLVRVLCAPSLSDHWLTLAMMQLRTRYPAARVSLRSAYSREIAESVALREADIGFAFAPAHHPAVHSEPIADGRVMCVGAFDGDEATLEALARQPVIDLDPGDPIGHAVHAACRAQGLELQPAALAHTYQTAVTLARRGLGVALVDSFTASLAGPHGACEAETAPAHGSTPVPASATGSGAGGRWRCLPLQPVLSVQVHALRPAGVASSLLVDPLVDTVRRLLQTHASGPSA